MGITLGKYGDEWDNKSESEEGYVNCVKRALRHNWNREHIGGIWYVTTLWLIVDKLVLQVAWALFSVR